MVCRLCSAPKVEVFGVEDLEYGECPRCGYIGLARAFFPSRTEEEARYRLHRNEPSEPGYRAYLSAFIDAAIEPFAAKGSSALDFGSGPVPALSLLLNQRGFSAQPYDPYFAPGGAWRRRAWDAIALHEVAEHLRSPGRTLAALARRLEPEGILALRTRFLPESRNAFASWWYRRDSTHLGFWRPASFEFLARELGLELILVAQPDIAVLRRRRA